MRRLLRLAYQQAELGPVGLLIALLVDPLERLGAGEHLQVPLEDVEPFEVSDGFGAVRRLHVFVVLPAELEEGL